MTYAQQLKDYENAVIQKRFEELSEEEVPGILCPFLCPRAHTPLIVAVVALSQDAPSLPSFPTSTRARSCSLALRPSRVRISARGSCEHAAGTCVNDRSFCSDAGGCAHGRDIPREARRDQVTRARPVEYMYCAHVSGVAASHAARHRPIATDGVMGGEKENRDQRVGGDVWAAGGGVGAAVWVGRRITEPF